MVPRPPVVSIAPATLFLVCALAAPPAIADPILFPRAATARDMVMLPSAGAPQARTTFPPVSSAADGTWQEFNLLQVSGPLAIHDSGHDRLLSLGGSRRENWALPLAGPHEWQPLPRQALPSFDARTSVQDPSTGLVYFLGRRPDGMLEFNTLDPATGAVASLPASGGPPAQPRSAPLFDPVNQRLVIYGSGIEDPDQLDPHVWALDLLPAPTWSQWTPAGVSPPVELALSYSFAVLDPVRRRMVFPTSIREGPGLFSMWALTLDGPPEWLRFATNGLVTQSPNPSVYDPVGDRLWTIDNLCFLYALSLVNYHWSSTSVGGPGPSPRQGAGVAIDVAQHRLLVFGGTTPSYDTHSDTWALSLEDPPAWMELVPNATRPPNRGGAGDGHDATRRRLVVFGGYDEWGGFHNDTWALDLDADPAWSALATQGAPPPGRYSHASAWDPARDQLVVFGGYGGDGSHPLGDLWALSFAGGAPTWSQSTPAGSAPAARFSSQLVYDSARDRFLLLFGVNGTQVFDDVWELRLSPTPTWRRLAPGGTLPAARGGAMCAYDPPRDRVLMFGGGTLSESLNDLWALNLGSGDGAWQELPVPPGPSIRSQGLLRLDTVHDRLLLFGGYGLNAEETVITWLNDTWALGLTGTPAWRSLSPAGFRPTEREGANGAYDALHDRLVVACGGQGDGSNDVWALSFGDAPTPTLLDLASRDVTAERVLLVWAGAEPGRMVTAYRRQPGAEWRSLGTVVADAGGYVALEDHDVTPGAALEYRLGVTTSGVESFFGAVSVHIPQRGLALSARVARGHFSFTVQLPSREPATLALFDLAGRSVWSTSVGDLGAGGHEVEMDGATLPTAIYFARLSQGRAVSNLRIALVR